jgi:hypothetical protein
VGTTSPFSAGRDECAATLRYTTWRRNLVPECPKSQRSAPDLGATFTLGALCEHLTWLIDLTDTAGPCSTLDGGRAAATWRGAAGLRAYGTT